MCSRIQIARQLPSGKPRRPTLANKHSKPSSCGFGGNLDKLHEVLLLKGAYLIRLGPHESDQDNNTSVLSTDFEYESDRAAV